MAGLDVGVKGTCCNIILETVLPDMLRHMRGNGIVFGNFIFVAGRPRVQMMGDTFLCFFLFFCEAGTYLFL